VGGEAGADVRSDAQAEVRHPHCFRGVFLGGGRFGGDDRFPRGGSRLRRLAVNTNLSGSVLPDRWVWAGLHPEVFAGNGWGLPSHPSPHQGSKAGHHRLSDGGTCLIFVRSWTCVSTAGASGQPFYEKSITSTGKSGCVGTPDPPLAWADAPVGGYATNNTEPPPIPESIFSGGDAGRAKPRTIAGFLGILQTDLSRSGLSPRPSRSRSRRPDAECHRPGTGTSTHCGVVSPVGIRGAPAGLARTRCLRA